MVENFPLGVQWSGFINPNLEDLMETVLKLISGIRGMKANYSLIKGSNPAVIVHCDDQHSVVELDQFKWVYVLKKGGGAGGLINVIFFEST